jgi:iron(III) transport system substrate-binding protein
MNRLLLFLALVLSVGGPPGCKRSDSASGSADAGGRVVLYTSVDEPYVRPLIEQFHQQTGIEVALVTDAEASKSVGLAEKLRAEKDHPQADVWWSNECFLTINLSQDGVLEPYESPSATDIPRAFKDPEHRWAGSVLRVRVLVSAALDSGSSVRPTHLRDLLRPELKGRISLARPTAGTTGGHVAALYALWGKDRAEQFFRGLHDDGVKLVGGNSMVAELVARGDLSAGLCDNDDAADASANVGKLEMVLPDQGESDDGTLAMPCTVGLVARCPHPQAAKRLIDFLLSKQVDQKLIDAKFAWCSTRDASGHGKFMSVDYGDVARTMPIAIRSATAILEGR